MLSDPLRESSTGQSSSEPHQAPPLIAKEFAYTADELVRLYEVSSRWADHMVKVLWISSIPAIVFCVRYARGESAYPWLILSIALLIGGLYYPSWREGRIRRAHQQAEADGKPPQLNFECEAEYLTLRGGGTSARLLITSLMGVTRSDEFLFLYNARRSFTALPRRIFKGDEERRFLDILAANKVKVGAKHYR
jgi:hypothetical protein